jgi:type 1 glutamine amidotransferase
MPRVLYVSTVAEGAYAHTSRQHAGDVIAALGQAAGAFTVTVTEDVSLLTAANLANYDAVVFFTAGELPIGADQKAALLQFVSGGKGFVGIHSATDTFYTWPEYGDLIGGYFENHPWDQAATIRVEDQVHRSTKHLGASFAITDEIYVKTRQPPGAAARGGSRPASSCVSTNWLDSPDSLDSLDSLVRNWMR